VTGKDGKTDKAKKPKKASDGSGPFDALRALRDEMKKKASGAEEKTAPARRTPPPRAPTRTEPSTPEDEVLLFHRLFAGVEPIDRTRGRVSKQPIERSPAAASLAKRGAAQAREEAAAVHEHLRELVEGRARFEVTDDGRRVEGRRVDVSAETVRHLRRGRLPIDARLDLHGMTVPEARAQLELFLRTMRSRNERCVLVIHGKGEHSPRGAGILRGEIAAWLSQGSASEHVAAFATAQRDDGGEGAVYILLRR
jgi:DNA-nicking Smr family endonuclease